MRFKKLIALTLLTVLPNVSSFADHSIDARDEEFFRSFSEPSVIPNAQIIRVIARASSHKGDGTDDQAVPIPEGWAYFDHSIKVLSSHYDYKVNPYFVRDPKNQSRIIEVHIKAESSGDHFFDFKHKGSRSWVDVQLDVIIIPLK